MVKKLKTIIQKNSVLLILFIAAGLSLCGWLFIPCLSSLFLNLLTGFISSIFTVIVIDKILQKREEKDQEPIKLALYREVQLFASSLISLWSSMYEESCEHKEQISVKTLFTEKTIDEIAWSLHLDKEANVIPKQTWFSYLSTQSQSITKRGNKLIDRYAFFLEPELFQVIYYLCNEGALLFGIKQMSIAQQADASLYIPHPHVLISYFFPLNEQDLEAVNKLLEWCSLTYSKLKNHNGIYEIQKDVTIVNPNLPPRARIEKEDVERLFKNFKHWSDSQKK